MNQTNYLEVPFDVKHFRKGFIFKGKSFLGEKAVIATGIVHFDNKPSIQEIFTRMEGGTAHLDFADWKILKPSIKTKLRYWFQINLFKLHKLIY